MMLNLPMTPEVLERIGRLWGRQLAYDAVELAWEDSRDDLGDVADDLPNDHPLQDSDTFAAVLEGIRRGLDDALEELGRND